MKSGDQPARHARRFDHTAQTGMGVDMRLRAHYGEMELTMPAMDEGNIAAHRLSYPPHKAHSLQPRLYVPPVHSPQRIIIRRWI